MTEKKKTGFFKGLRNEMKKIHWLTRKEAVQYTILVLVIAAIVAAFSWALDLLFGGAIGLFV